MPILSKIKMTLFWIGSLSVALMSYRFLPLGLETAFPDMAVHIENLNLVFLLHVSAAPLALALGVFQLWPWLRVKIPMLHRYTGRLYVLAVFVAGLSSLIMALNSFDRPSAALGFGLLSVFWLATTFRGIQLARARDFAAHRVWMIRSYALTFAAVTLRIYLLMFSMAGFTYMEASIYLAWMCWVPNLIFAEWLLRKRGKRKIAPETGIFSDV